MKIRSAGLLVLALSLGCFSDPPSDASPGTSGGSGEQGPTGSSGGTTATTNPPETSTTGGSSSSSGSTDETSSGSTDPQETDSTSGGIELLECVEALLDPALGTEIASFDTQGGRNSFEGTCGGGSANDVAFQWIAPFTEYFVFDTTGSDFDTALYLLETCEGDELACSDNALGGVSSRIVARYESGEQIVIVVDGETGEDGNAVLSVNPVTCPNSDLEGQTFPGTFTNIGGTSTFSSDCGGNTGLERTFRYTAEATGLHSFRATSAEFQPIMNVQIGAECGGADLQCNSTGPGVVGGEVIRNLETGDVVTLIVDSAFGTGEFDLDVQILDLECPADVISDVILFSGELADYPHAMTTSCGNIGESLGEIVTLFNAATFSWMSPGPQGTSSGCDLIVTTGFPAALSLQAGGTCSGVEEQCATALYDKTLDRYTAAVSVGHVPAAAYTLTVTQTADNLVPVLDDDFLVEVACFASA